MTETAQPTAPGRRDPLPPRQTLRRIGRCSVIARGEPMLWLTGSALVLSVLMIVGLLGWVAWQGFATFWPLPLVQVKTHDGRVYLGEISRRNSYRLDPEVVAQLPEATRGPAQKALGRGEPVERMLLRTGNFELAGEDGDSGEHYNWVDSFAVAAATHPTWAVTVERLEWGRFYGFPRAFANITPVHGDDSAALRERAAEVAAGLHTDADAIQYLVRRDEGHRRDLLVEPDAMQAGDVLLGVAEVWRGSQKAWHLFKQNHDTARALWHHKQDLEENLLGAIQSRLENARLRLRQAQLDYAPPEPWVSALAALDEARAHGDQEAVTELKSKLALVEADFGRPSQPFLDVVDEVEASDARARKDLKAAQAEIDAVDQQMRQQVLAMETADGQSKVLQLYEIVRAYPANQLGLLDRSGVYLARWGEFLTDDPRESNFEGGVFPAIFGTVLMTLIMCLVVVPFGVLAALYLREYAKAGPLISIVRIAINNLAGVPSIVFGVFGLGFFCYIVGASIDEMFFAARLPQPTFGTGGLLWASITLALLTLPVVIVATEEALAAVPNSMREGSYACGASKWQTIRRIVLPRAMPGIMTGAILAMARGAGEVAPLMLVGAVKLARKLPLDTEFPFGVNLKFMHLGFHIYDLGFQSQNSLAAKPMVYTTTLLLIALIAVLNLTAVYLRSRLHRKFVSSHF